MKRQIDTKVGRYGIGAHGLAIGIAALLTMLMSASTKGQSPFDFTRTASVNCREAIIRTKTDFDNIRPFVADEFEQYVTTSPNLDGEPQAELTWDLKHCVTETLTTSDGTSSRDDVAELIVAVISSYPDEPPTAAAQQFVIAAFTNFPALHAAWTRIGMPSFYVPDISINFTSTGLLTGAMSAFVPGKLGFEGRAAYVEQNVIKDTTLIGVLKSLGPHGVVRETHTLDQTRNQSLSFTAPLLSGSIDINDSSSFLAQAQGSNHADNSGGFYLLENQGFTGTTRLLE